MSDVKIDEQSEVRVVFVSGEIRGIIFYKNDVMTHFVIGINTEGATQKFTEFNHLDDVFHVIDAMRDYHTQTLVKKS